MKKKLKIGLYILIAIGAIIQVFRPDRSNPEFDRTKDIGELAGMDSSIARLFRRSCYDCHSYETRWPWYSNVAPVSWLLASDVDGGRRHVNFSIWGKYAPSRRSQSLDDMHDEITSGDMPLPKYLVLHPDARLTQAERDSIVAWADREKARLDAE
jgi:hypothetical protein